MMKQNNVLCHVVLDKISLTETIVFKECEALDGHSTIRVRATKIQTFENKSGKAPVLILRKIDDKTLLLKHGFNTYLTIQLTSGGSSDFYRKF
jgi:hypothetical protein